MMKLENLYPERVFYYFEKLTEIPHGSRNTKQISDYLVSFAKEHELNNNCVCVFISRSSFFYNNHIV